MPTKADLCSFHYPNATATFNKLENKPDEVLCKEAHNRLTINEGEIFPSR